MEMKIAKVTTLARKMKKENHSLRYGQALFNALADLDRERADWVRGTDADPFYDDRKVGAFFEWLSNS